MYLQKISIIKFWSKLSVKFIAISKTTEEIFEKNFRLIFKKSMSKMKREQFETILEIENSRKIFEKFLGNFRLNFKEM